MCLPNFIEFRQIEESNPIIGYRSWKFPIKSQLYILKSLTQDFEWSNSNNLETEVTEEDSGFYSYYYNYYDIQGIILQWGKVAIHKNGYRSECTKIDTLFTIRESDAKGPAAFINWIKEFNSIVEKIASIYKVKTIHFQDWEDSQK